MKSWCLILVFFFTITAHSQFIVDQNFSATELIRDVLVNNSCAETSDYRSFTGSNIGDVNGIGYFNAENTDFPFKEGIILSTGNARDAAGPNIDQKTSGSMSWQGDDDLSTITDTTDLFNASFIEFDFIPSIDRISFNFLFASEEYFDSFQCSFSDVFAFILTDASGTSTNLAIVPGTNDPVSVVNIRPGFSGFCGPKNASFFDGVNTTNSDVSFHGMTKSLKAVSDVNPGEIYNIKMVIADNQDTEFDSAVFLEAGSFTVDVNLGEDRTILDGNPLCIGEEIELDATTNGGLGYKWFEGTNELTAFENMPIITVNQGGTYAVEITFSGVCSTTSEITLDFITPPIITETPVDLTICDINDGSRLTFDLTSNTSRILGNQNPDIYAVTYYRSIEDATLYQNKIVNANAFSSATSYETIFARISSGRSCNEIASFQLKTESLDIATTNTIETSYTLCRDSDLNIIGIPPTITTSISESEYLFSWYLNSIDEANKINDATSSSLVASEPGMYFIEIEHIVFGCSFLFSTEVISIEPPLIFEVEFITDLFAGNNVIEIIAEGNSEYLFSVDDSPFDTENRFENLFPGEHTARVTDINGCQIQSLLFDIIDYPRFFTPNGDGANDEWKITSGENLQNARVAIFNRLGQLIKTFNSDESWDGIAFGSVLPESDYWFSITYEKEGQEKVFKSHFTLKR